jgi:hypothetical protein
MVHPAPGQTGTNVWGDGVDAALAAAPTTYARRRVFDVMTYGAVGDGTTDDTVAINAAITAANAVVNHLIPVSVGKVEFPDADYLITSGLVFNENVVPHMSGSARLIYNGTGTAITFYRWGNNSLAYQGDIRVAVRKNTAAWWGADTTSIGILFDTCFRMGVEIGSAQGFHTGIALLGDGAVGWGGTTYLDMRLGHILNNKIGMAGVVQNGGYVSAINLFGGTISLRDTGQTVRTNLFTDPSCTALTEWASYAGVAGAATLTAPTSGGWVGPSFARLTWTTVPTSSGGLKTGVNPAVVAGTSYTASVYVRPSVTLSVEPKYGWFNSGTSTTYGTDAGVSCPAGVWTRLSATHTCPTGSNQVNWAWYVVGAGITAIGQTLDMDGALMEVGTVLGDYFDGGSLLSAWTGTANASTSTSTLASNIGTRYIAGPLAWSNCFGVVLEGSTVEKAVSISEDHNTWTGCSFEAVRAGGVEITGVTGNTFMGCMNLTSHDSPTLVDSAGHVTVIGSSGARFVDSVSAPAFYAGSGTMAVTPRWTSGAGSPESVLAAPIGSLYSRTDGGTSTTLYVKQSGTGSVGWVAK